MGVFHGRQPISRKMSRPWNRELGWSLLLSSLSAVRVSPGCQRISDVLWGLKTQEVASILIYFLPQKSKIWELLTSQCTLHVTDVHCDLWCWNNWGLGVALATLSPGYTSGTSTDARGSRYQKLMSHWMNKWMDGWMNQWINEWYKLSVSYA